MTRRSCWLLLHIAWGIAVLPGCHLFPRKDPLYRQEYVSTSPKEPVAPPPVETKKPAPATSEKRPDPEPARQAAAPEEPVEKMPPVVARRPEKPLAPLVEALRCMLEDRHQDALHHLQAYDQETQVFLLRLLPTLALFDKKPLEQFAPEEAKVLYAQLQGLLVDLRPLTPLVIEKLVFCTEVNGYGDYKALPPTHAFRTWSNERPGDQVQLYFELSNFASEPRGGGFETRLSTSIEIRDAAGNLKKRLPIKNLPPRCSLTRLHDYYDHCCFCVPPELEPGTYQLTLQVVDETVTPQRVARESREFRVTAAPGALSP